MQPDLQADLPASTHSQLHIHIPNFYLYKKNPITNFIMPTAGEARLAAAKRTRSPDGNNNQNAAKKPCDPKAESKIPKPANEPIGKRASQKAVKEPNLPTEAQLKHQEILRTAQADQDSLAATQAKLLKEATEFAQGTDPEPTPGPSGMQSVRQEEPQEADPNFAYPQGYESLDLTFVYTLADDPHKALQVARNTAEVLQAK